MTQLLIYHLEFTAFYGHNLHCYAFVLSGGNKKLNKIKKVNFQLLGFKPRCRGFESLRVHHIFQFDLLNSHCFTSPTTGLFDLDNREF